MYRTLTIIILFLVTADFSEAQIQTVKYLSSKELAGRLPGHTGYTKAANFIANEFAKLKLKPGGNNCYFQNFKIEYNEILAPEHFSVICKNKKINYQLGTDYVYRGFTGAGKFITNVVFCGYGLSEPDSAYDDYTGIDVKNKIALVFKYNPKWKNFPNGYPREKAITAAKHGAVGILFVSFPNDPVPQKLIGSVLHGSGEQMTDFPQIHIELHVVDKLFESSGFTLKQLQSVIDSTRKPFSVPLENKVDLEVHTKYEKEKEVPNVVGILEGGDSVLKNEYIILGAHLDHVGNQAGKIFFPGANDNASGSAAVLEAARKFVSLKEKPKRSVIFVLFASEEQGLNGSSYFADHMSSVKAMINLDCIGYGDSIQVNGGKSFPDLWKIVKEIDMKNDKLLVSRTGNGVGADAEPFFKKGIPTLYFVTTNSYQHLHLLSDTWETINQKLLEAVTRLSFLTAIEMCNKQNLKK